MSGRTEEKSALLPKDLEGQQPRKSLEEAMDVPELATVDNDTPELREDGKDDEPIHEVKTILQPAIERNLEQDHPEQLKWYQSLLGMMSLYGVVIFSTLMAIYEIVLKGKALAVGKQDKSAGVNMSAFSFWSATISIVIGLVLAIKDGRLGEIFCKKGLKMCLVFQPAAVGFAISQFLGFFTLRFLATDVQKVLDQSRLLITAVVMMFMLKKKYSRATWAALVVISIAAYMYSETSKFITKIDALKAGKEESAGGDQEPGMEWLGIILVLSNSVVMAASGVYAEKFMKAYKATPFYIQKTYLELGNLFFQTLMMFLVSPAINGPKKDAQGNPLADQGNPLTDGMFTNVFFFPLLIMFFMKGYLQGILVKKMSSLVKAISAVVATCAVYFFNGLHMGHSKTCPPTRFFCIKPLNHVQIVADILVFCAVMGYVFAGRDKTRKQMYRSERDALKAGKA